MAYVSPYAQTAYSAPSSPTNPKGSLTSDDFIKLMITQLSNQDPLEPMKNQDLLAQVSQIGTLQSQNALSDSLKDMVLQNQVSAASGMIGKKVSGLDANGSGVTGVVTSVKVANKQVSLELDNGKRLELGRVTGVAPGPAITANPTTEPGLAPDPVLIYPAG